MAIMFSMLAGLLIIGMGVAIDTMAVTSQKETLQSYADAAVLAAVTSGETDIIKLQAVVDAIIANQNIGGWAITATARIENETVIVDASTVYDTSIMGMAGFDHIPVNVTTASPQIQATPINLALVLDTTDSMSGDNIEDLQDAVEKLLQDLEDSGADVRVALVPFGEYVNIQSQNGAAWLDTSLDGTSITANENYNSYPVITPGVCTPTGNMLPGSPIYADGVLTGYNPDYAEQSCTSTVYGPPVPMTRTVTTDYIWHGCAGSRTAPLNIDPAFGGTQIPGAMQVIRDGSTKINAFCGQELIPLTNDLNSIDDAVKNLTTSGNTYIPTGLMWGWRVLDPAVPFTESSTTMGDGINAILLMTDGANTRAQNGVHHNSNSGATGVTLSSTICEAIKTDGLQIFTVGYQLPGSASSTNTMLENCASNASYNFDANNAQQLKKAFEDIGVSLRNVRLSY